MSRSTEEMRVLVTGGRNYPGREMVFKSLDKLITTHMWLDEEGIVIIIHGASCEKDRPLILRGADRWADEYAKEHQLPHILVPAQWNKYGRGAGPIRNRHMLEWFRPTNVLALPGGPGTADMIFQARKAGLLVYEPVKDATVPPTRRMLRA